MERIARQSSPAITRLGLLLAGGSLLAVDVVFWREALTLGFHPGIPGYDFALYRDAAAHWLATGEWFRPYQLEGPYGLLTTPLPILYPPPVIPFFLAWSVVPAPLYWIVPVVGTAWIVWSYRPSWQALTVIAGCLLWPTTFEVLWLGNPTLWIAFLVALATRWPAFAPWVLLKPSMLPFAFVGIHRRTWWLGLVALVAWCLPWLPTLPAYLAAVTNLDAARGFLYSWPHYIPALIPVVAWLGRQCQREVVLDDVARKKRALPAERRVVVP